MRPADARDVRRHNLSLVVREVAERGPRSRATIALETGLNKTTVSSLVAELIELGLLRESGHERPGAVGRPAQNVEVDPAGPFVLGLEVNVRLSRRVGHRPGRRRASSRRWVACWGSRLPRSRTC